MSLGKLLISWAYQRVGRAGDLVASCIGGRICQEEVHGGWVLPVIELMTRLYIQAALLQAERVLSSTL